MAASAAFAAIAFGSLIRGCPGTTWLAVMLSVSCFVGGLAEGLS